MQGNEGDERGSRPRRPFTAGHALLIGAAAGIVLVASGLLGLVALSVLGGYSPGYLIERVGEGLFARATVAALEARVANLEAQLLAAQPGTVPARGAGPPPTLAAIAPGGEPASPPPAAQASPSQPAPRPSVRVARGATSAAPPLAAAPTPAFSDAATVADVTLEPLTQPPDFSGREWRVCAGADCDHQRLTEAVAAARDGDVIRLAPGLYTDCLRTIDKAVAIVGEVAPDGTRPTFDRACAGKAALIFSASRFRLESVQIQDISVGDRNGACIRLQPGRGGSQVAHLRDVICLRSENGLLGGVGPTGGLIVERSLFAFNGRAGRAHGLYVTDGREVILRDSVVQSTRDGGHSVKVGAGRLLVVSSIIAALDGDDSRAMDFFGGGLLYVTDSIVQQGPRSQNHDLIGLATEPARLNLGVPHAVYIRDSWLIWDDDKRCCRWLFSGRKTGEIVLDGVRFVAIEGSRIEDYEERGGRHYADRREAGLPPYRADLAALPQPAAWVRAAD